MPQTNFSGHESIIIHPVNDQQDHNQLYNNKWKKSTRTVQLTPIHIGGKKNRTRRLRRKTTQWPKPPRITQTQPTPIVNSLVPITCSFICLLGISTLLGTLLAFNSEPITDESFYCYIF
eukprot:254479_1